MVDATSLTIFTAGEIYTLETVQTQLHDVRNMQPSLLSHSHISRNQAPALSESNNNEVQQQQLDIEAPMYDQNNAADLKQYLQRLLMTYYEKVANNPADANQNLVAIGAKVKEVN